MQTERKCKKRSWYAHRIIGAGVCILTVVSCSFSCGGGMVPYVPSGAGAGSGQSSGGQFFLFDKGVTTTMFDYKSLQPLFKNIVTGGNERKARGMKKGRDIKEAKVDSTKTHSDSTGSSNCNIVEEGREPVLNLHKLH